VDRTRKATREINEATLQHVSKGEASLIAEIVEEKLTLLLSSVEQMKQTPEGIAELDRRVKAFGQCGRSEEETSHQFYDKLRRWLERDIPQTKFPLHPPRQTG